MDQEEQVRESRRQELPTEPRVGQVTYDKIRHDTGNQYLRALKSCRDGQPNLAHGKKRKNKEKLKTKTE